MKKFLSVTALMMIVLFPFAPLVLSFAIGCFGFTLGTKFAMLFKARSDVYRMSAWDVLMYRLSTGFTIMGFSLFFGWLFNSMWLQALGWADTVNGYAGTVLF